MDTFEPSRETETEGKGCDNLAPYAQEETRETYLHHSMSLATQNVAGKP